MGTWRYHGTDAGLFADVAVEVLSIVPLPPWRLAPGPHAKGGGEHMKAMKTAPVQVLHMTYKAA
jgi:hypothetical protein